jgi:hypothetical protein
MYEFLIDSPAIYARLFHWIFRNSDRSRRRRRSSGYRNSSSRMSGGSIDAPNNQGIMNRQQHYDRNNTTTNTLPMENHVLPSTTYDYDVMLDPDSEFWVRLRDPVARPRDIALTYELIYDPILSILNAEQTKTWMWLSAALLINVACIQIEIMLFQGIMEQEQDMRGDNSTSTSTTPLTTPGINRYLRSG